jgi:hypothetical protein
MKKMDHYSKEHSFIKTSNKLLATSYLFRKHVMHLITILKCLMSITESNLNCLLNRAIKGKLPLRTIIWLYF